MAAFRARNRLFDQRHKVIRKLKKIAAGQRVVPLTPLQLVALKPAEANMLTARAREKMAALTTEQRQRFHARLGLLIGAMTDADFRAIIDYGYQATPKT